LAAALVLIEVYLITSSILDKTNENNQIQVYCGEKCNYNPDSLLWEFTGENFTKGYTTRQECFNYCSKVKQGFAASILDAIFGAFKR
jgi:hypothetical protein